MSLFILPDEILKIIFGYCDLNDLIQLIDVCKRFREFITLEFSKNLLITSEMSEKFRQRCHSLLSYKSKFSTSNNWQCGIYKMRTLTSWGFNIYCYRATKFEHLLQMTKDTILLSNKRNGNFLAFNRTKYGTVSADNWVLEMCLPRVRDIFPCNDIIITNHVGGEIRQWTIESLNGKMHFNSKTLKKSMCQLVDANLWTNDEGYISNTDYVMDVTPQHIILGSSDGEIKIWKYIREENAITKEHVISPPKFKSQYHFGSMQFLSGELNSIAIDPTGTKFVAGSTHDNSVNFTIYDINKCYTETNYNFDTEFSINYNKDGNQLLWENPNTFLILKEEEIKKVDVRTHKVVHTWESPVDPYSLLGNREEKYLLTCISTDSQYAFMTGTSESRVILWDQRQSTLVQKYKIPFTANGDTSIVQCLQFDNSKLYFVADRFYELDFYNAAQALW